MCGFLPGTCMLTSMLQSPLFCASDTLNYLLILLTWYWSLRSCGAVSWLQQIADKSNVSPHTYTNTGTLPYVESPTSSCARKAATITSQAYDESVWIPSICVSSLLCSELSLATSDYVLQGILVWPHDLVHYIYMSLSSVNLISCLQTMQYSAWLGQFSANRSARNVNTHQAKYLNFY